MAPVSPTSVGTLCGGTGANATSGSVERHPKPTPAWLLSPALCPRVGATGSALRPNLGDHVAAADPRRCAAPARAAARSEIPGALQKTSPALPSRPPRYTRSLKGGRVRVAPPPRLGDFCERATAGWGSAPPRLRWPTGTRASEAS